MTKPLERDRGLTRRGVLAGLAGALGALAAPAAAQQFPGGGPKGGGGFGQKGGGGAPPQGAGSGQGPRATNVEPTPEARTGPPIIDVHAHLQPPTHARPGMTVDFRAAARAAVAWMDKINISRMVVMPPPYGADEQDRLYDFDALFPAVRSYPTRFAVMGGGGLLNPLLHGAVREGKVTPQVEKSFTTQAQRILAGGAVGFGEMSCEHLSYFPQHPYNAAPPDHPLLLLLADIAAERNAPIDLHMEAVMRTMPTPPPFPQLSPRNPSRLNANIDAFQRLLAHNRRAKISWAHIGVDATRQRTPQLCRELLRGHSNLYLNMAHQPIALSPGLLDAQRRARPEWVQLIEEFPDRVFVGTDSFHSGAGEGSGQLPRAWDVRLFVNQMADATGRKLASENARAVYSLPPG